MIYSSSKFLFVNKLSSVIIPENSFVVDIHQEITDQNGLYDVYKKAITFPNYFGQNWNAFFDLLKDFHWVSETNIIIRHFITPSLGRDDLKTYLQILIDSIDFWKQFENHKIIVYFSVDFKSKIDEVLSQG
jgi:hypothetical protein